jgi:NADH-quinone oxidoreductase subunit N
MLLMVGTENLLMIFVALELTSLSLYVLAAFNRRNRRSAEAALKYFLYGAMAAAVLLFGFSLVYGLTGSIYLKEIAVKLRGMGLDPLLLLALLMVMAGFAFKVAAAPFHLWAPDAYQGAPTPSAAFIASGSKVAGFYLLAKVFMLGFGEAVGDGGWRAFQAGWAPLVATLAAVSMILGNLAAIVQKNVKRLLAYSAIAHAGYALIGVAANTPQGLTATVYYVGTYGLATLGAFAVLSYVEDESGDATFSNLVGLGRRAPVLSVCMLVFILSLAGIPPLARFFGKFYVFAAAVNAQPDTQGLLWVVILANATSAVALYYYLQVLKKIYVTEPAGEMPQAAVGRVFQTATVLAAVGVLLLGCAPNLLVGPLAAAMAAVGF